MAKVQAIKLAVQQLSSQEVVEFRRWFYNYAAPDWDEPLKPEAHSGPENAQQGDDGEGSEAGKPS